MGEMNTLANDARTAWSLVPTDCKLALSQLRRSGRWDEARSEILIEAEKGLRLIGGKFSVLDVMAALELAAEHWLEEHPC